MIIKFKKSNLKRTFLISVVLLISLFIFTSAQLIEPIDEKPKPIEKPSDSNTVTINSFTKLQATYDDYEDNYPIKIISCNEFNCTVTYTPDDLDEAKLIDAVNSDDKISSEKKDEFTLSNKVPIKDYQKYTLEYNITLDEKTNKVIKNESYKVYEDLSYDYTKPFTMELTKGTYTFGFDTGTATKINVSEYIEKLQILAYDSEFNVTSDVPIYEVGNITETREWEYKDKGEHYEIVKSNKDLFIDGNYICNYDKIVQYEGTLAERTTYPNCIKYPSQIRNVSGEMMETRIINRVSDKKVNVTFIDEYDPTLTDLTIGLVGCWDMDNLSGDEFNGNYPLTSVGTLDSVTGKVGNATYFDGTNFEYMYSISFYDDNFEGTSAFSYAIWIRPIIGGDRGFFRGHNSSSADNGGGLMTRYDADSGGTIRIVTANGIGDTIDIESSAGIQTIISWQHIAYTWNATGNSGYPKLYINSTENIKSINDSSSSAVGRGHNFIIGRGAKEAVAQSWGGYIDSVMIWKDKILTSSEIEDIYNSHSGRSCSDLIGAPPTDSTPPHINITGLVNGSIFNYTKNIQFGVMSNESGTAEIIINGTTNSSFSITASVNYTYWFNATNGTYFVWANNTDASSNEGTSTFYNFSIQNVTGVEPPTPPEDNNLSVNLTLFVNNLQQDTTVTNAQTFYVYYYENTTNVWNLTRNGTEIANNSAELREVGVYNYTIATNGTIANFTNVTYIVTVTDGTLPEVNISINNSAPKINEVINITANITDETELSFCQIIENMTNTITNYSITTPAQCSKAFTISLSRGNVINFSIRANDTTDNWYTNTTIITVANTEGSIEIGKNLTIIKINNVINISGNISEPDGDIAFGWVVDNRSGTNINYTFEGSGFNFNFSQNITVNLSKGNVINFSVFYNDTAGTQYQASTKLTVSNTEPETPVISYPVSHNNYRNVTSLNYTSSDIDGDTITYNVYINGTLNASTLVNITQFNASDGYYNMTVYANDGDNSNNATVYFTLDQTPPTMCGNAYIGLSYGSSFEYTCSASDASGIANYTINETGNFSISTSGTVTNITNLQPHVWVLQITANDTFGNNNTAIWTINVSDTVTPALDIIFPTDYYYQNVTCINLSIRDDFPNNISVNDSRWNLTFINNSEAHFCNHTAQKEGNYTLEVQYNDTWGNTGYYNISYVIDRTKPVTSLVHPANSSSWTVSNTVILTYNVTDIYPIDYCEYEMDGYLGRGASDTSITKKINQTFSDTFTNGAYYWYVNCTDEAGNMGHSGMFNLTVNYVAPSAEEDSGEGTTTKEGSGALVFEQDEGYSINESLALLLCPEDVTLMDRLFSKCKIEGNEICDDGENYIMDEDCNVALDDFKSGAIFKYMWFLRFMLLFSIFLLMRNSNKFPLAVVILLLMFIYNGAFISDGVAYDQAKCIGESFIKNLGYCLVPTKPALGWIILASVSFIVLWLVNNPKLFK